MTWRTMPVQTGCPWPAAVRHLVISSSRHFVISSLKNTEAGGVRQKVVAGGDSVLPISLSVVERASEHNVQATQKACISCIARKNTDDIAY